MKLQGKTVALFVAEIYEDSEYWYPYYRLQEEGARVVSIGPKAGTYGSKHGAPAEAERGIADVDPGDFDALVIPGGYAPDHMRREPRMAEFVAAIHRQGKPVAAICHAGWMLASAGILQGKTVTSFSGIRDDLVNAGATWVDQEVVVDQGLVTSRHPPDLPAFCRSLIGELSG